MSHSLKKTKNIYNKILRGILCNEQNYILPDLIMRGRNRRLNAKLLQVNTPNGIFHEQYVSIGGIEQWITIRGEDRNLPILLFVHGGPGSPYTVFNPLLRPWEKHFTIVQWEQRGAGKTYRKNGKEGSGTITFNRLVQDGIELAEYLCHKLGQQKIILIGSSLGSLIGTLMVKQRPDLFHAYVGTDQNSPDPHYIGHKLAVEAMRTAGHKKAVQFIETMGPDPSKWSREDFDKRNPLLVKAIRDVPNMIMDLMLPSMLSSPAHRLRDIKDIFQGMNFSLDQLFESLMSFGIDQVGTRFELPFFIFQGDNDIITPTETAKAYFDQIEAPHKQFALIKQAGHLACFARPEQFLDELLQRVNPLLPKESG